jgi:hypothetical protein
VLALKSGDSDLQRWTFAVTPDTPPTIRFSDEPKRAVNGALELHYEIKDDYGAARRRRTRPRRTAKAGSAPPLYDAPELPLALPRRNAQSRQDHPRPDRARLGRRTGQAHLTGEGRCRQEARSETKTFRLPERTFTNPLAARWSRMRRILASTPTTRREVLEPDRRHHAAARGHVPVTCPLSRHHERPHAAEIMAAATNNCAASSTISGRSRWHRGRRTVGGRKAAAAGAGDALKQALENGASDEEIEKLMKELREAMNEFCANSPSAPARPEPRRSYAAGRTGMRQSDLERMLDQIENMAKSGNREQAQDMLSQLRT